MVCALLGWSGVSRLLLVRHGQSTWNAEGRWQGQADPPLSDLGVEQAETAAAVLDRIDAVWSSDLQRANHTARILSVPHALEVAVDPRIREREAGPWTGLTRDEIEAQFPGHLSRGVRPAGYETDDSLAARTLAALTEIATALDGRTAVVVTHGGVIVTVERHHGLERTPIHNLEARWLEWRADSSEVSDTSGGGTAGFVVGERVTLL